MARTTGDKIRDRIKAMVFHERIVRNPTWITYGHYQSYLRNLKNRIKFIEATSCDYKFPIITKFSAN